MIRAIIFDAILAALCIAVWILFLLWIGDCQ